MKMVYNTITFDRIKSATQIITMVTTLLKKVGYNDDLFVLFDLLPSIILWLDEPKSALTGLKYPRNTPY